jgi:hypothetical protein
MDINDSKYDLDLLKKFTNEIIKILNSKTIRLLKDENLLEEF